jgi:FMN phosphatase YigB (HAD superfamily)
MYRAILFDFYGVWGPDTFAFYVERAQREAPDLTAEIQSVVNNYFLRLSDIQEVADSIHYKFNMRGIEMDTKDLYLPQNAASPEIVRFLQYLHGHFIKVGILANLGRQERAVLEDIQRQFDLFDTIMSPDTLGMPLLSPDVFAKALQEIGEPPQDCLVISASDDYLAFAASLGLKTLKFEGFPKLVEAIRQQLEAGAPGA